MLSFLFEQDFLHDLSRERLHEPEPMFPEIENEDEDEHDFEALGYANGLDGGSKRGPIGRGSGRVPKRPCRSAGADC